MSPEGGDETDHRPPDPPLTTTTTAATTSSTAAAAARVNSRDAATMLQEETPRSFDLSAAQSADISPSKKR